MVDGEPTACKQLGSVRVFIVEDESLILMLLEDILEDLGCQVAASALNLRQALDSAATTDADVAILDINLNGDPIYPVAEALVGRGVPIIFASGYGATTLPEAWKARPTLPKPFSADQVATALRAALDGAGV